MTRPSRQLDAAGVKTPRPPAFTLIELLIVLAVIALLAALLSPALSGARHAARSAVCSSNLRQWAVAVHGYSNDNAGFLPRRGQGMQPTTRLDRDADWFNALPSQIGETSYHDLSDQGRVPRPGAKSVWMCPEAAPSDAAAFFAYGMNMRLSTWEAPQPDRIDAVAPTAAQVFMAESPGTHCSLIPSDQPFSPVARHSGNTILAFLDGHVAQFSRRTVGCGIGDPLRSEIQWRVPNSSWTGPTP